MRKFKKILLICNFSLLLTVIHLDVVLGHPDDNIEPYSKPPIVEKF